MDNPKNMPADYSQTKRESFVGAVLDIKKNAYISGLFLTDSEISRKIGISIEQFNQYYAEDNAPENLFLLLRSHYQDYIKIRTYTDTAYEDIPDPENDI